MNEIVLDPKESEGVDLSEAARKVGWGWPIWVERELYRRELATDDEVELLGRLAKMLDSLSQTIARQDAAGNDADHIIFQYWRKLKSTSKKEKPVPVMATLHQHPIYANTWMLLEYGS